MMGLPSDITWELQIIPVGGVYVMFLCYFIFMIRCCCLGKRHKPYQCHLPGTVEIDEVADQLPD